MRTMPQLQRRMGRMDRQARDMPVRLLWLTVGLLSTGSGIAGMVLPLVPTTPFLLLGAYAFARSSPRLHEWLVTHPRFGRLIADWRAHRAIGARSKIVSMVVIVAAFVLSVALGVDAWVLALQAVVLTAVGTFVVTRPLPPSDQA